MGLGLPRTRDKQGLVQAHGQTLLRDPHDVARKRKRNGALARGGVRANPTKDKEDEMSETDQELCKMLRQAANPGFQDPKMGYLPVSFISTLHLLLANLEKACKGLADARKQHGFLIRERSDDLYNLLFGRRKFRKILLENISLDYFRPSIGPNALADIGGIVAIAASDALGSGFPLRCKNVRPFLGSKVAKFRLTLALMTKSDRKLANKQWEIAAAEITLCEHRIAAYLFLYELRDQVINQTKHLDSKTMVNILTAYGFDPATDTG